MAGRRSIVEVEGKFRARVELLEVEITELRMQLERKRIALDEARTALALVEGSDDEPESK